MLKISARILALPMLLAALSIVAGADLAHGQIPTPTKTLCAGEPDLANFTCTAATAPAPFVAVFYQITIGGPGGPAGTFNLQETYPVGFVPVSAHCKRASSTTWNPLAPVSGPTLASVTLAANEAATCVIAGYFDRNVTTASNSVTVADATGTIPPSFPATLTNPVSLPQFFPADLETTKTVSPASIDVSGGPQTLTYTITLKNNGPVPAYIGPIGELFDNLAIPPSGVALQAQYVNGSATCTSTLGAHCLATTPSYIAPSAPPPWVTVPTTAWLPFLKWWFPATGSNAAGYMPANSTITLTYQVMVRRHPDLECVKVPGGDKLRNQAFFGLTRIAGITIDEGPFGSTQATNNTSTSPDVAVNTGVYVTDPECGVPIPGVVSIEKLQVTPQLIGGFAWNTDSVTYRIKLTNTAPSASVQIRLRDISQEWAGTPLYDAHVQTWTCNPACPPPTVSVGNLTGYYTQATVWDRASITLGAQGSSTDTFTLDITLVYRLRSCDNFPSLGLKRIRNIARVDYVFGSPPANFWTAVYADTFMQPPEKCPFEVDKKVVSSPNKIVFGPPGLDYEVSYSNVDSSASHTVGTLIDAVRIVQPNYATGLPFSYTYSCQVTAGSITGAVPTAGSGSGTIVHTAVPSQGARIIQNTGPIVFGPNSTLQCKVHIEVKRPPVGDPWCLSSVQPQLENLALMDPSRFYNANLPWPPSASYNSALPSQPSPLTSWHTVSSPLPKCHRLIVNKKVLPGLTWTPGGPTLAYTVTFNNAGDTLTGMMGPNGWEGPLLNDHFLAGSPYAATGVTLSSTCSNPSATWGNWSGAPAGYLSFLPIINFPAGCSIVMTYTAPGPYQLPGPICNRAAIGMFPQDSPDWYANDPTPAANNPHPASMQAEVCTPVVRTYALTVKKEVKNIAGASLSGMTFPVKVTCSLPPPNDVYYNTTTTLFLTDGGTQTVPNIPAGATCTATEAWTTLATPVESSCKPPTVPGWVQPTFSPPSVLIGAPPSANTLTVTNTIDCVTARTGILKVCKVAGLGVAVGTPFTFTAGSATFTVPAGPAPGGTCVLGASFPVGSTVTVTENIPTGIVVSNIAVAPTNRLVGTPNLAGGSVSVTIGSGVTEVTFTDKKTGHLEICKKGETEGHFVVNPGGLGPFVVPPGACSPAIEVPAGEVVIQELKTPGASLTGCATIPANQQGPCDPAAQTSTVNVAPGDISTMTIALITNTRKAAELTVKKVVTSPTDVIVPNLSGVVFPVSVVCTPSGPTTTITLSAATPSQVIPNIPVGSACTVTELPLGATGTCGRPLVSVAAPPTYVPGQSVTIAAPPATNSVEITNVLACIAHGSLRVEKRMFGVGGGIPPIPPGVTFPVQVACTPNGPNQTVNLTATTPSVTLPNIPATSVCTITELAPVGPIGADCKWDTATYPLGTSATIPAQSTIERVVQNRLVCEGSPTGSLRIEKRMAAIPPATVPPPIPPGVTFPVRVACTPSGPTTTINLPAAAPSVTLPNIAATSVCTITELDPVGPIPANCRWDTATYPLGQNATIPAQSSIERVVQNALICPPVGGSLGVGKQVVNAAGVPQPIPPNVTFPVLVACAPNGPTQNVTLTSTAPNATVPNIAAGSICLITELPPLGPLPRNCRWGQLSPPQSVTVPAQTIERTVRNVLICG